MPAAAAGPRNPVVVVDASAIAAIAFGDEQAAEVAAVLDGEDLSAPSLFELEMTNATLTRCRRAPSKTESFVTGLGHVLGMPIALHAVDPLAVLALAFDTGLTAYDAAYLWLSHEMGVPLVTLDKKLAAVARRSRVLKVLTA